MFIFECMRTVAAVIVQCNILGHIKLVTCSGMELLRDLAPCEVAKVIQSFSSLRIKLHFHWMVSILTVYHTMDQAQFLPSVVHAFSLTLYLGPYFFEGWEWGN